VVAVSVHELDLPSCDTVGIDREQRLAVIAAARAQHWLARTPLGFALTRYEDVVGVLRDRRFHSALSLIPQMRGCRGQLSGDATPIDP